MLCTMDSTRSSRIASLHAEHSDRLVRMIARRFPGLGDEAQDAAAFAWMQLVGHAEVDLDDPVGWLYVVAGRQALVLLGKAAPVSDTGEIDPIADRGAGPEREVEARAELERVLRSLSPAQRLVLGLLARGHSYEEVAAGLGRTRTWVNRHAAEGRAAARKASGQ